MAISIAIVTKNRVTLLLHCVRYLLKQATSSDEILIIDNNSSDATKQKIQNIQKHCSVRLRYILEKKPGIANARNRALQEAKHTWLVFIDDDCIPENTWLLSIKNTIFDHPELAAICGKSLNLNSNNAFADATDYFYRRWIKQCTLGNKVTNYEIFDTKNAAVNRKFLKQHRIRFDARFIVGEDCDLGHQLFQHKGPIAYLSSATVGHRNPTSLLRYMKTQVAYMFSMLFIQDKWQKYSFTINKTTSVWKTLVNHKSPLPLRLLIVTTAIQNSIFFTCIHNNLLRSVAKRMSPLIFNAYLSNNKD